MSRRDTTSKGASSILAKGSPIRALPCILLPTTATTTIILCLVVGLHKRTALRCTSWIFGMQQKKIPLPNGPCMHCHVDDGSGNFLSSFFFCMARTHARNTEPGYNSYLFGAPTKENPPKSNRASEHLFFSWSGMHGGGAEAGSIIFCQRCTSAHTDLDSVTLSWPRISLSLWVSQVGYVKASRQTSNEQSLSAPIDMHLIGLFGPRIIHHVSWQKLIHVSASITKKDVIFSSR